MRYSIVPITIGLAVAVSGTASADRVPVQPQVQVLRAPSLMTVGFNGTVAIPAAGSTARWSGRIFGREVRPDEQIPAGAAVLRVTFPVYAGHASNMTVRCPRGTGSAGFGEAGPNNDVGVESPLGVNRVKLAYSVAQDETANQATAYVLCTPVLRPSRKAVSLEPRGVRAPVALAAEIRSPVSQGQPVPDDLRLLVVRLRAGHHLVNGQPLLVRVRCPHDGQPMLAGSSSSKVRATTLGDDVLAVQPPQGLSKGERVRLYGACGPGPATA